MSTIEQNIEKTHNALLASQGKIKASLRIDNAQIADLYNGEFFSGSLCVYEDIIVGYKHLEAETVIDAQNAYILPNFMDAHVHIESSMLSPARFAELVIPFGTGTVVADPHEIANVQGMDGIKFMLTSAQHSVGLGENSKDAFFDMRMMLPSCVPALPFEDAGANLLAVNLAELIEHKKVLGLGEMMNVFGVVNQDKEVMDKINLAKLHGKMIDGHSPAIDASTLDSYALAGVKTDHECTKLEEVWDRLRRGMYVLMREGSAAHDLLNLLPAINASNARYCMFCTDDRHAADIVKRGHINTLVRMAVAAGIEPIQAVRMASLNIAECYGIKNKGSLAVGMEASFMFVNSINDLGDSVHFNKLDNNGKSKNIEKPKHLSDSANAGNSANSEKATNSDNLSGTTQSDDFSKQLGESFTPHAVFIKGKKVAENGKMLAFGGQSQAGNNTDKNAVQGAIQNTQNADLDKLTLLMRKSMNFVMPKNFDIPVESGKARLIKVCAHSLFTECEIASVGIDAKGNFDFTKNKGILKLAVIERHKGTGKIGLGLLHAQYGLQNGAIATTIAHDSHNIVVAGDNDADMLLAVETLKEIGGGIVMTSQGKVLASLELPLGGLMSEEGGHAVAEKLEKLLALAKSHYHIWDKADAFMTLSFLALPVIPELKLTASGLFDVNTFSFVNVDANK